MANINDTINQVDTLVSAVEKASAKIEESVTFTGAKMIEAIVDSNKEIVKEYEKHFTLVEKKSASSAKKKTKDEYKQYQDYFSRLKNKWKQTVDAMDKHAPEFMSGARTANVMAGGAAGLQGGIAKVKSSILSELPMGGLVGLALYGRFKESEFAAAARTAEIRFQRVGEVASQQGGKLTGLIKTLESSMVGTRQEVLATADAFASAGVTLETALSEPITTVEGLQKTLVATSLAADKFFQVSAGTNAKMMGQVMETTGKDAASAQEQILKLGFAARGTGQDFNKFVGSALQVSANLRMMRVDIEDVARSQLTLQEGMEKILPGASKQYIAAAAQQGMAQVSQGVAGMNMGLSAVIGERMSRRLPGTPEVEGLDAYVALREGFQGEGGGERDRMFMEMVNELGMLTEEQAGTRAEQIVMLEKLGFGFEGGRAIVAMRDEIKRGTSVEEAFSKNRDDFQDVMKTEAQKTSEFQRALKKSQFALQEIGSGLLTVIVTGFSALIETAKLIGQGMFGNEQEKTAAKIELRKLASATDQGLNQMVTGLEKLKDIGIDVTSAVIRRPGRRGRVKAETVEGEVDPREFEAKDLLDPGTVISKTVKSLEAAASFGKSLEQLDEQKKNEARANELNKQNNENYLTQQKEAKRGRGGETSVTKTVTDGEDQFDVTTTIKRKTKRGPTRKPAPENRGTEGG